MNRQQAQDLANQITDADDHGVQPTGIWPTYDVQTGRTEWYVNANTPTGDGEQSFVSAAEWQDYRQMRADADQQ